MQIFNPGDYPDTTSGGLIEKVVPIGVEMNVRLEAIKISTSKDVKQYPINKVILHTVVFKIVTVNNVAYKMSSFKMSCIQNTAYQNAALPCNLRYLFYFSQ